MLFQMNERVKGLVAPGISARSGQIRSVESQSARAGVQCNVGDFPSRLSGLATHSFHDHETVFRKVLGLRTIPDLRPLCGWRRNLFRASSSFKPTDGWSFGRVDLPSVASGRESQNRNFSSSPKVDGTLNSGFCGPFLQPHLELLSELETKRDSVPSIGKRLLAVQVLSGGEDTRYPPAGR